MDILPEDYDDQSQGSSDAECEVLELREQIAMLTKQFYQERQQWLEEKRQLQEAAKPLQAASSFQQTDDFQGRTGSRLAHQQITSGMLLGSEAGSEAVCEDASQGGLSGREPCSSFCSSCQSTRSASPNQTGSAAGSSSTASMDTSGTHPELMITLADLRQQLEESRRQQESATVRWALEREALQRQIHALISMSAETGGASFTNGGIQNDLHGGLEDGAADGILVRGSLGHMGQEVGCEYEEEGLQVSKLEVMVEELQAERENLLEQLRVLAADTTRARWETRGTVDSVPCPALAPQTSAPAATAPPLALRSRSPSPPIATTRRRRSSASNHSGSNLAANGGGGGAFSTFHALTLRDSVNVAELLAEKTNLERELRHYREEFVAVSRAEYANLSSLHKQMTFMETEMEQLRGEVEEAARMRAAAEAELAEALQDCVTVPQGEYQRLIRLEAESLAREAVCAIEAASPAVLHSNTQTVPLEEHRRLLAAMQERDALAGQITSLQHKLIMAKSEAQAATAAQKDAEEAAAAAAAEVEAAADASASAAAAAADADAAATQFELTALREQLAATVEAAVAESRRLGVQVLELYEEVEMLRNRNLELQCEAEAARRTLASGQMQANGEVRAAAAAAEKAHAAALGELQGLRIRIAALEGELGEARKAAEVAEAERDSLSMELAAVRDAALRTSQALSAFLHKRYREGDVGTGEDGDVEAEDVGLVAAAAAAATATVAAVSVVDGEEEEKEVVDARAAADGYDEDDGEEDDAAAATLSPPWEPAATEGSEEEEKESGDEFDVQSRLRVLQEELEAMRRAQEAARVENIVLMREAEAVRQALADSQAAREAAEAAAAAAAAASEAAARELDVTKVQLAEAQALEQLFTSKRECFQLSRRVARGLPPEWLATVSSPAIAARAAASAAAETAPVAAAGDGSLGAGAGGIFGRLGSGGPQLTSVPLPAEAIVSEEEEEEDVA